MALSQSWCCFVCRLELDQKWQHDLVAHLCTVTDGIVTDGRELLALDLFNDASVILFDTFDGFFAHKLVLILLMMNLRLIDFLVLLFAQVDRSVLCSACAPGVNINMMYFGAGMDGFL